MLEDLLQVALVVPLDDPNAVACRWGVPTLLWGDPGIGKSSRIKKLGLRLGLYVGVIFPSGRLPEDFAGVPVMDGQGGLKLVCTLQEITKLNELKEGILCIDEINTARAAVQASMHGVVLDRRSGDIVFAPKIRIIAAANPIETSTGGHVIEVPLANRFLHIDCAEPNAREWSDYMMGSGNPDPEDPIQDAEATVAKKWPEAFAEARGQFTGYVQRVPNSLQAIPPVGHPDRSKGFPTARTMETACRVSATCLALGVGGVIESKLLAGCIGQAGTEGLLTYRKEAKLPSPKQVLSDGFDPDKKYLDRSYAVYTALAAYIASLPNKPAQAQAALKAWPILNKGCEAGLSDLIYESATILVNKQLASIGGKALSEASAPVISRFGDKFQMRAQSIYNYHKRTNAQP